MAIYGLEEIERALNMSAIDTLILSEKVDLYKLKGECQNCQYQELKTTKMTKLDELTMEAKDEACPKCNSNSFKITEVIPIIEYLGGIAETVGTNIEILSAETELGESLYSTFGGVVAILRYKIGY
jgi:peptide chain release factor subunit 1